MLRFAETSHLWSEWKWLDAFHQLQLLGLKNKQTFDVALKKLGQDAIGGQLVKHTAQELLGYTCHIAWYQHTAKQNRLIYRLTRRARSFKVSSYLSACPEKLPLDANLKEIHELWMSPKSGLWHFIERWSAAWTDAYLPTDCMMSSSIGAAKSGLRWMNIERTITARLRVSSSYSSSTAAQSRHLIKKLKQIFIGQVWPKTKFPHLSDIKVGCSSMNSSGAGTNMLTVLGADKRLVFVGPTGDQDVLIHGLILTIIKSPVAHPSPKCRCCAARWTDAPAVFSSADS